MSTIAHNQNLYDHLKLIFCILGSFLLSPLFWLPQATYLFFLINFSSVTLVAHLKNTMTYLPPAKYIPAKKTR